MSVEIIDGKYVYFGKYPQTGSEDQPIRWRIVDNTDGLLTLITDVILFNGDFDLRYSNYEKSKIRKYITGEFSAFAFSSEEQALIVPTCLEDGICDNVFLPSLEEMRKIERTERIRKATPYAKSIGTSTYPCTYKSEKHLVDRGWYWTRTPYKPPYDPTREHHVWYISYSGSLETRPVWGPDIGAVLMIRVKA